MIVGANEVDLLTLPRDLLSLLGSMPVKPGGGRAGGRPSGMAGGSPRPGLR